MIYIPIKPKKNTFYFNFSVIFLPSRVAVPSRMSPGGADNWAVPIATRFLAIVDLDICNRFSWFKTVPLKQNLLYAYFEKCWIWNQLWWKGEILIKWIWSSDLDNLKQNFERNLLQYKNIYRVISNYGTFTVFDVNSFLDI